jgi:hypothetical protein
MLTHDLVNPFPSNPLANCERRKVGGKLMIGCCAALPSLEAADHVDPPHLVSST